MLEVIDANGLLKRSVQGPAAHDAAATGNPVLLGAYAKATAPSNVSADADVARLWCDLAGRLQVGDGGATLSVDDGGSTLSIDDGGSSITVDGTVTISDGGGSITVDGTLTATVSDTHVDRAAFSVGTSKGFPAAYMMYGSAESGLADGEVALARIDSKRAQAMVIEDAGTRGRYASVTAGGLLQVQSTILTGTSGPAKAEDDAHSSGDVGFFALAVRKDTAAQTAGTDGDYCAFTADSSGRLHVNVGNTVAATVTNAGTFAVQVDGAALTSLQLIDDVVFAEDVGHNSGDKGIMALAVRKDTAAQLAGTDADYSPLINDASGRLWVNTEMPDAAALSDSLANPTTPLVGACQLYWDANAGASTWRRREAVVDGTLLASAARTADTTSASQTNYGCRGAVFFLNVSAIAATPGIRLYVQGQDSISSNWFFLTPTPTTHTATGQYGYELSPGASTATFNGTRWAGSLPRIWRIYVSHDDADSITYSVSYSLLP